MTSRSRRPKASPQQQKSHPESSPTIKAEAALSFLKDTKGTLSWRAQDLGPALNIKRREEREQILSLLEAQGYIQPGRNDDEWITTPAGEAVSGAKAPRFTREHVEQALESLRERIKQTNQDPKSPFKITEAVAFGDFLLNERARVQAADVGIALSPVNAPAHGFRSAREVQLERKFLKQLRGRTGLLHIAPYAEWMSQRSHVKLK
jgi:hypothetical protein